MGEWRVCFDTADTPHRPLTAPTCRQLDAIHLRQQRGQQPHSRVRTAHTAAALASLLAPACDGRATVEAACDLIRPDPLSV